jgi:hypothetical protein
MNSSSTPVVPPAPLVHAKDLPIWKLLLQFTRDSISTIPDYAFDMLVSRRRVLGIDSLIMNDPEGVRRVLGTAMEKYKRLVSTHRVLAGLGREGVFLAEGAEWRRQPSASDAAQHCPPIFHSAASYVEVSSGTVAPPIACQAVIPPTRALAS